MAIRPDDAATLAKGVQELYAEAETTLLQRIAAALASGRDAPDWAETKLLGIQALSRQADGILADLAGNVPGAVERAVGIAYNRGIATAGADLSGAGLAAGAFAEVTPTGAAAAIVSDTIARLTPMSFQIRRAVTDVYQQVVTQVAAQTALGTVTRREASAKILTRLASQGVTGFRDVAGRQWAMSSYAEMAARTSASNAMLQGHTDRITELGIDTVIVSNAPEDCELCRPFEGKVLSLSGRTTGRLRDGKTVVASLSQAKGAGLYHPNCRHSHSVYLPGITKGPETDTADPEGNALRVKQRAYERRIRELKRQDVMAQEFGGPAAKQARAKLNAKTAEFRDWRTANGRKNLSYRTSTAAPKPETAFAMPKAAPKVRPTGLAGIRAANTPQDVAAALKSYSFGSGGFDNGKVSISAAKEVALTAARLADKYPDVDFAGVYFGELRGNVAGNTLGGTVRINTANALNDAARARSTAHAVRSGHHHDHDADQGLAYTMTHEFGHVIDNATNHAIRDELTKIKAGLRSDLKVKANSPEWRKQVSTYGAGDPAELIAEAFADVEINGVNATELSKRIHAALVKKLKARQPA